MRIRMTKAGARVMVVSAAVVAGAGFGTLSAQAAEAPSAHMAAAVTAATAAIHAGNAPQCIETSVGTDGMWWDTQTATNTCSSALRVKLEWAVASSDCQTLQPSQSMTYEVLKPAWAEGADTC